MPIDNATIDLAAERVRLDIMGGFDGILDPVGGNPFSVNLNESPLASADVVATSEVVVVVPWVYRCVHTGMFLNVPPTYIEFDLLGTTFVNVGAGDEPDAWTFYRYIDYLCALHHIGISTSVRPALQTTEYLEWNAHPH